VLNAAGSREDRVLPHTMLVNASGQRFVNEGLNYYDSGETFGQKISGLRSNYPAWLLFDQQGVDRYALLAWKVPEEGGAPGIHVAPTLDELAAMIDVPAAVLRASVERFNGFARSGVDEDFHRGEGAYDTAWGDPSNTPNPCLGTLEKGPFYAVKVRTGALATRGGLRIDNRGRVIGVDGAVIDGLYAAGNCSDGGAAGVYAGAGATIGGAMTFGYVVGREIARVRSAAGN
jgi:3-oxosteroid 1-dehydrogenase